MEWTNELFMALQLLLSFLLGGLIGWEREYQGFPAGIRTFGAIAAGSCVFGLISWSAENTIDPTRIAAQVVSGVGFLGIGIIFRHGNYVRGLTTAATLWSTAAVGLAIAFHMYVIGILTTLLLFLMLFLPRLSWWERISKKTHRHQTGEQESEQNKSDTLF